MRVVAGTHGGRTIVAPPGTETRPTSDRVRGAVFNALFSLDGVEDATVLDAFAGSGGLGIEALSRGAAHATFVERDRAALAALRANLDGLDLGGASTVVAADAERLLEAADPRVRGPWDLVVLDPPYGHRRWDGLLAAVAPRVAAQGLVVCESSRSVVLGPEWELVRERVYGGTVVTIARCITITTDPRSDAEAGPAPTREESGA